MNYNVPIEKVSIDPKKVLIDGEKVLFTHDNLSIQEAIDGLDFQKQQKEKQNF